MQSIYEKKSSQENYAHDFHRQVKLFIGSLPPHCTNKDIYKAFKKYGYITSVNLFRDYRSGLCKGFGDMTLQLEDSNILPNLLKQKFHIKGRKIYVEEFLEGNSLEKKNEDLYQKRIHVKQLPLGIKDKELLDLFSNFGPVQSAYQIKTVQGEPMTYGYVTFFETESAERCLKQGYVNYKGDQIECCEFEKREINKNKTNNKHNKQGSNEGDQVQGGGRERTISNFNNNHNTTDHHQFRSQNYHHQSQNNYESMEIQHTQNQVNQNFRKKTVHRETDSFFKQRKALMKQFYKEVSIRPGQKNFKYGAYNIRHYGENIVLNKKEEDG